MIYMASIETWMQANKREGKQANKQKGKQTRKETKDGVREGQM